LTRLGPPLALLALAQGCGRSPEAKATAAPAAEAPPIAVSLVPAREISVPRVLTLSGSLVGSEHAEVAAGAAGKVLATYVERGSVVKKGALLARIDGRILGAQAQEAAAQVESLRAQQAQAKLDCDRTKHMLDKGAISRSDFDRAQTQCETSKWTLAAAEAKKVQLAESMRDTDIRAPFAGEVVERVVTAGEYVRADSRVVTLYAVDSLRVELTVPESEVTAVKQGMEVQFTTASGDRGARYKGKIRYIGPAVRQQTRDAIVEAVVDNPNHALRPGMFVTAQLALGQQPVAAVPASAVKSEGTQRHLFVATGDRLEDRLVQVADATEGNVPILNGVKPGEMVVDKLTPDVRDGARVK
jgi:membrane fusion protein (multidrug efflux system)